MGSGHTKTLVSTWPLRAEDKGTGLDNLQGSFHFWHFMTVFLLHMLHSIKRTHSLYFSQDREEKLDFFSFYIQTLIQVS